MKYSEIVRQLGKKININYYLKSIVSFYAYFINYNDRYQPLSKFIKKSKDEKNLYEDEISNMKDILV